MGKINGACCHCSELAGKTASHPDSLGNQAPLFALAVITEGQKGKRRATVAAERWAREEPLQRQRCATRSHSWGARAGSPSLQGPAGRQCRRTCPVFLVEGQGRGVSTAVAGLSDCFRARPQREKGGAAMA